MSYRASVPSSLSPQLAEAVALATGRARTKAQTIAVIEAVVAIENALADIEAALVVLASVGEGARSAA